MKTNNSQNQVGRKAVGLSNNSTPNKAAGSIKPTGGVRGRKKKVVDDDDKFADLNMGWGSTEQDDISSSWTGSTSRRKNYNDDEDSDSYEGTGYGRERMDDDDELNND
ncbi:MAG: hypothetical protein ACXWDO_10000, partial [Bacteroidia bacterium]